MLIHINPSFGKGEERQAVNPEHAYLLCRGVENGNAFVTPHFRL